MSEHERCPCHDKTEAELAAPYAAFAFLLAALSLIVLAIAAVAA